MAVIRNPENKIYTVDENFKPTHKQVVRRVSQYYRVSGRASVVLSELVTSQNENPDVLCFYTNGSSVMIECKVSRSDFLADKKKIFRRCEERGVGIKRYYACPEGIIQPKDLPEGWGLLYLRKGQVNVGVKEIVKPVCKESNKEAECCILISAIRRLEISTAVFVRQEGE